MDMPPGPPHLDALFPTAVDILLTGMRGAAFNVVTEDYPELARKVELVRIQARLEEQQNYNMTTPRAWRERIVALASEVARLQK